MNDKEYTELKQRVFKALENGEADDIYCYICDYFKQIDRCDLEDTIDKLSDEQLQELCDEFLIK